MSDTKVKTEVGSGEFKPGQRRETPPPGAGSRVFYESLYKQNPDSLMALKWCVEHGVLAEEDCGAAMLRLEKLKQEHKEKVKKRQLQRPQEDRKPSGKKRSNAAAYDEFAMDVDITPL